MESGLREREFWNMTPVEVTREIACRSRVALAERRVTDSRVAWLAAHLVAPHLKRANVRKLSREFAESLGVKTERHIDLEDFADMLAESRARAASAGAGNGHHS